MKKALIVLLVLIGLGAVSYGVYFVYQNYFAQEEEVQIEESKKLTLDTKKIATHLSKAGNAKKVYWQRAWDISWGIVEPEEGDFDWAEVDKMYEGFQERDIYLVTTVKPFANWDQDKCHDSSYEADFVGPAKDKDEKLKVGKPCDMEKYKKFLEKLVERYDGDGIDDMPGLTLPVKYWEIMNEPSMQGGATGGVGEELKFFVGTSQEYLDILRASYQMIKKADPKAKVLHAGMAGMQQHFQDFWDPIFSSGAGDYFDVANIHSISTDEKREDMYLIKFKKYLEKFGIKDKPIFVTEAQFGDLAEKPENIAEFEKLIARSTIFTLAQGADVIFYIENWLQWDVLKAQKEGIADEKNGPEKMFEYSQEGLQGSTHKVYLNLVDKVNQYDKIVKIKEEFVESSRDSEGATSQIGQYKFVFGSKSIYVLWGEASVPAEISGQIKVTDIYGNAQDIQATDLKLKDEPVFVEIL